MGFIEGELLDPWKGLLLEVGFENNILEWSKEKWRVQLCGNMNWDND